MAWRHYLVVAPVGEEGWRVAGVDAGDRREEAVASGCGAGGASEETVHAAEVPLAGEAGEVGGRVERRHGRNPGVPGAGGLAAGRRYGVAPRVRGEQREGPGP